MRFLGYLILLALIGYGIWPYYTVYRLDAAINQQDASALAVLIDLPAIRANYKARVKAGVQGILPMGDPGGVMGQVRQGIEHLGDAALDQVINAAWVQTTLRDAITRVTHQTPPYLIGGIEFAFFESFNRFLIRIGSLGHDATHIRLSLVGSEWRVTDIITSVD